MYIYIYIYMCVCVCVCIFIRSTLKSCVWVFSMVASYGKVGQHIAEAGEWASRQGALHSAPAACIRVPHRSTEETLRRNRRPRLLQ